MDPNEFSFPPQYTSAGQSAFAPPPISKDAPFLLVYQIPGEAAKVEEFPASELALERVRALMETNVQIIKFLTMTQVWTRGWVAKQEGE